MARHSVTSLEVLITSIAPSPQLRTLLHLAVLPRGSRKSQNREHSSLGWRAYYLECFQHYPLRTWLHSVYCGHANWYTRAPRCEELHQGANLPVDVELLKSTVIPKVTFILERQTPTTRTPSESLRSLSSLLDSKVLQLNSFLPFPRGQSSVWPEKPFMPPVYSLMLYPPKEAFFAFHLRGRRKERQSQTQEHDAHSRSTKAVVRIEYYSTPEIKMQSNDKVHAQVNVAPT
ncbi:hypothetical protein Tco_0857922 [Tanacetum coccineum]|uniref:Uncharacterized protein n=1 Tax=Tanacetum coccineum TaxID=301880 RepID=A0ABQ5B7R7_9ASTR